MNDQLTQATLQCAQDKQTQLASLNQLTETIKTCNTDRDSYQMQGAKLSSDLISKDSQCAAEKQSLQNLINTQNAYINQKIYLLEIFFLMGFIR